MRGAAPLQAPRRSAWRRDSNPRRRRRSASRASHEPAVARVRLEYAQALELICAPVPGADKVGLRQNSQRASSAATPQQSPSSFPVEPDVARAMQSHPVRPTGWSASQRRQPARARRGRHAVHPGRRRTTTATNTTTVKYMPRQARVATAHVGGEPARAAISRTTRSWEHRNRGSGLEPEFKHERQQGGWPAPLRRATAPVPTGGAAVHQKHRAGRRAHISRTTRSKSSR